MNIGLGDVFGGYRIDAVVGRGPRSVVYRATEARLNRVVALKVLDPDFTGDALVGARFMREYGLAADLDHPNVIPIYATGEEAGRLFVAMRFVDGGDLGAAIKHEGRLRPAEAARIVALVAGALDFAHSQGLVHRQVRPSNILLGSGGHVYLSDFGIFDTDPRGSLNPEIPLDLVGYLAPEQILGGAPLGASIDVYALGCVLFHALTGRVPFDRSTPTASLTARLTELPPSATEKSPDIPPKFDAVIRCALSREPSDRFGTAGELGRMALAGAGDSVAVEPARDRPAVVTASSTLEFRRLDTIAVRHPGSERRIDLCSGDLTELPASEMCDVLVVSALPESYFPTPGSLIGALARKGISVAELARRKAVDLRLTCSCWLSEELVANSGIQYKRILCFEPAEGAAPAERVGDIFRALLPFLGDQGFKTVAVPVVSTGNADAEVSDVMPSLLEAAVNWMSLGTSLEQLKIFAPRTPSEQQKTRMLFTQIKHRLDAAILPERDQWAYDVFLSYAHENGNQAQLIIEELSRIEPGLRLFVDRHVLNPGSAWQHEIFDALDSSRKVLAVYSPAYVVSKVCKEEFNIAWARGRETDRQVLFPVYLFTAQLPTYMKLVQYMDCREGSPELLAAACKKVTATTAD